MKLSLLSAYFIAAAYAGKEDVPNATGRSTLQRVTLEDNYEIVSRILSHDDKWADHKDTNKQTALHLAAYGGVGNNIIDLLLNPKRLQDVGQITGRNVNTKDYQKQTPLHIAARYGSPELISLLMSYKSPINEQDKDGNTPLHLAARFGSLATMRELLLFGADYEVLNSPTLGASRRVPFDYMMVLPRFSHDNRAMMLLKQKVTYMRYFTEGSNAEAEAYYQSKVPRVVEEVSEELSSFVGESLNRRSWDEPTAIEPSEQSVNYQPLAPRASFLSGAPSQSTVSQFDTPGRNTAPAAGIIWGAPLFVPADADQQFELQRTPEGTAAPQSKPDYELAPLPFSQGLPSTLAGGRSVLLGGRVYNEFKSAEELPPVVPVSNGDFMLGSPSWGIHA